MHYLPTGKEILRQLLLKRHQEHLGINSTIEVQDLHTENYKPLLKETDQDPSK